MEHHRSGVEAVRLAARAAAARRGVGGHGGAVRAGLDTARFLGPPRDEAAAADVRNWGRDAAYGDMDWMTGYRRAPSDARSRAYGAPKPGRYDERTLRRLRRARRRAGGGPGGEGAPSPAPRRSSGRLPELERRPKGPTRSRPNGEKFRRMEHVLATEFARVSSPSFWDQRKKRSGRRRE
jgi:hypothetical protein